MAHSPMRQFRRYFIAITLVTVVMVIHVHFDTYVTKRFIRRSRDVDVETVPTRVVNDVKQTEEKLLQRWNKMTESTTRRSVLEGKRSNAKHSDHQDMWLKNFTGNLPDELTLRLQEILERDFEKDAKSANNNVHRCEHGYFRLSSMTTCSKWLGCKEISRLKSEKMVGSGGVKTIFSAIWRGRHEMAVASVRKDRFQMQRYVDRAKQGIDNLLLSQPSPYTTQVVGYCIRGNYTDLAMEACKYGDFRAFYMGEVFRKLPTIEKFKFAIQFVAQIDYLHRGFGLPRLHCDMHNVYKAFQQFLVSSDLRLFMNDLDDVPEVDKAHNKLAGCKNEKKGVMSQPGFIAPEMRYTQEEYYNRTHKKQVDEKTNIWKIPDITANVLISDTSSLTNPHFALYETGFKYDLQDKLKPIHERCKNINPEERPSSKEVLVYYLNIYNDLISKSGNS